jgi:N-methylhydantoinase A
MRYSGQWLHSLLVRIPPGELTRAALEQVVEDFRLMYDSLYGNGAGVVSQGVELVTTRIHAVVRLERPDQAVESAPGGVVADAGHLGTRRIFWPDRMESLASDLFDGSRVRQGDLICGPAVVELPYTSIAVGVDQALGRDAFGNFLLRLERSTGHATGDGATGDGRARTADLPGDAGLQTAGREACR